MPSKMNKIIKRIKAMKIFKKKNKSYEKDTVEDMVYSTGFGTKERIESMNSVYEIKGNDSIGNGCGHGCGHRRDLDFVDVKGMNVDGLKEKASVGLDSVKTSAMNSVNVKNVNVDGLKEKASVGLDSVKTSAMNSVGANVDELKEKASVGLDSVKISAMNSVDVKNVNVDGLKEKASVGLDSLKTSAMNSVDAKNVNVDGLKEKASVGLDSVKTSAMNSVDAKNMNVDGLKEKYSINIDYLKKLRSVDAKNMNYVDDNNMNVDGLKEKNMNVDDVKSNSTFVNKKMDISENEFIREKSLSMDSGLKEVDSVEDHDLKNMKRTLSMDSMDFNGIKVNKEEWYFPSLESIKEERECKPFEWFKKCLEKN